MLLKSMYTPMTLPLPECEWSLVVHVHRSAYTVRRLCLLWLQL